MDINEIRRHIEFHKNEQSLANFDWHDGAILYLLHIINELDDIIMDLKKRVDELEKENEVLQSLYSAEREMHSRDTVDGNERLNNYKKEVEALKKFIENLLRDKE